MTDPKPNFFRGARKTVTIESVNLLKNASGDKRIKLGLSMVLSNDGATGIPEWVAKMFEAVAPDNSPISKATSEVTLEGTTIRCFPTEKHKTPSCNIASATLKSFVMSTKKARGKDLEDVVLSFASYQPASTALWDWSYGMLGCQTFCDFAPTQMSFGEKPEAEDEEDEE